MDNTYDDTPLNFNVTVPNSCQTVCSYNTSELQLQVSSRVQVTARIVAVNVCDLRSEASTCSDECSGTIVVHHDVKSIQFIPLVMAIVLSYISL